MELGAWSATPNLLVNPEAGVVSVSNSKAFAGRVPVSDKFTQINVEAELRKDSMNSGWVGLGIGAPVLGVPTWGKGIYVILYSDGRYTLAGNDDPNDYTSKRMVRLDEGLVPRASDQEFISVVLSYDSSRKSVSLAVNGETLVESLSVEQLDYQIEPKFAGISGYGQDPGVVAKAFSLWSPEGLWGSYVEPEDIPVWKTLGEPVKFKLSGRRLPEAVSSLRGVVTDIEGTEIDQQTVSRDEAETDGWTWLPGESGFYEVEFFALFDNGEEVVLGRSFTVRAPTGNTAEFMRARQGVAVMPDIDLDQYSAAQFGFTYTFKPEQISLGKLVGFNLANIHSIPWGAHFTNLDAAIEPEKGVYRWDKLDPHVEALADAGMTIAGQFCYTPLWASPHPEKTNVRICVVEGTAFAPKDLFDYGDFVYAVVERYKDKIHLWELWNEPAIPGGSVFWADTPERYVELMEEGYGTIKSLQPDSEVWIGGFGSRSAYYVFYKRIMELGAGPWFDVMSLHGSFPERGLSEFNRIDEMLGENQKPAVVSEWHAILQGNSQSSVPLSESELSLRFMRDLMEQLKVGIKRSIFFEMFNLAEKEVLGFARENKWFIHSSGLFRRLPQFEPRHAAVVMANFLRTTGRKAVFLREVPVSESSYGAVLNTNRGVMVAIWSDSENIPIVNIKAIAGPDSQLLDWEGREIAWDETAHLKGARFYYLLNPDLNVIAGMPQTDRIALSEHKIETAMSNVSQGKYVEGTLFASPSRSAEIPRGLWLNDGWSVTDLIGTPVESFSAEAVVGVYDAGLDIVVKVTDVEHVQNETPMKAWRGDSIQVAVDSEGVGIVGGQTEFVAALTPSGPVLWKLFAADTRGDIPAHWSPAPGEVEFGQVDIDRSDGVTSYRLRIPWSEMYPLSGDRGSGLRLSIVVNDNNGDGRRAYLEWGGGIAGDKEPRAYGRLVSDKKE